MKSSTVSLRKIKRVSEVVSTKMKVSYMSSLPLKDSFSNREFMIWQNSPSNCSSRSSIAFETNESTFQGILSSSSLSKSSLSMSFQIEHHSLGSLSSRSQTASFIPVAASCCCSDSTNGYRRQYLRRGGGRGGAADRGHRRVLLFLFRSGWRWRRGQCGGARAVLVWAFKMVIITAFLTTIN